MSLNEKEDLKIRLLLRSVYLKGHQDGNLKTTDLSWEDKIVKNIGKLYEKKYLKGVEDGKEMVRKGLPTEKEILNIIVMAGQSTSRYSDKQNLLAGQTTFISASQYDDIAQAIHARLENNLLKKES